MEVDQEEQATPAKKRKLTKAAEAKLKAKEKKKRGKKDSDDEDDGEDDTYTALSKSMWMNSDAKPAVGSFDDCAVCGKQYTVVSAALVYTYRVSCSFRPNTRLRLATARDLCAMHVLRRVVVIHSRNLLSLRNAKHLQREGTSPTSKRNNFLPWCHFASRSIVKCLEPDAYI